MLYEPQTGYSHQLRAQSARHGYPILGDKTYGNFKANKMIFKLIQNTRSDWKHYVNLHTHSTSNHELTVIDNTVHHRNVVVSDDDNMIDQHIDINGTMSQRHINSSSFKRLFLHSHKLEVTYEFAGRMNRFKAVSPIPSTFSVII